MDFFYNILKEVYSLIGVAVVVKVVEFIYLYLVNRKKYSINGFWISEYSSAFDSEVKANDIVEIHSMGDRLIITYQQYYNKLEGINVFQGEGYSNSKGCLAFSYFFNGQDSSQVGVMILSEIDLKNTQKALKGKFFEYDTRNGIKKPLDDTMSVLKLYDIDYFLVRCKLTILQKIKFYFKKSVYSSYDEIENKYKELTKGVLL